MYIYETIMKIQLENISSHEPRSFQMMYNPRLSDLFFWHFHPEYELIYIEGATGTRHVGDHISTYRGSDLVLIGSSIPHLNFDYKVKTNYQKIVVHINPTLIEQHLCTLPELKHISKIFSTAQYGVVFTGKIKQLVGKRLMKFQSLSSFQQYMELLQIFKRLSHTKEFELLHSKPYINKYSQKEQERIRNIHAFIDKNYYRKIELEEVASLSNMSKEAFCRYFKRSTENTFIGFLNQYRISQAKRILMMGKSVGDACYSCGFESLSYFNRVFKKYTGEQPSLFRNKHIKG